MKKPEITGIHYLECAARKKEKKPTCVQGHKYELEEKAGSLKQKGKVWTAMILSSIYVITEKVDF